MKFIDQPILCFLVLSCVFMLLPRIKNSLYEKIQPFLWIFLASTILVYFSYSLLYLFSAPMIDLLEPSVILNGILFKRGHPLISGLESANIYGFAYGIAYKALLALSFHLGGENYFFAKLPSVLCGFLSLALISGTLCRHRNTQTQYEFFGYSVLLCLYFWPSTIHVHPESFLLLLTCAALFSQRSNQPPMIKALVLSLCITLAVHTKIYACVFFLPLLIRLWLLNRKSAFMALGSSFLMILALFLWSMNHIGNIFTQFGLHAKQGVRFSVFLISFKMISLVSLPLSLRLLHTFRPQTISRKLPSLLGWLATLVPLFILSSKPGAGAYYFLPLLPFYLEAITERPGLSFLKMPKILYAFFLASCAVISLMSINIISKNYRFFSPLVRADYTKELKSLMTNPGDTYAMGFGDTGFDKTFSRPTLYFNRSLPWIIDPIALFDRNVSGVAFPRAALDNLRRCAVRHWILPRNSQPFQLKNAFYPHDVVFPQEWRSIFMTHYAIRQSTENFDLWTCKNTDSGDTHLIHRTDVRRRRGQT